MRLINGSVVCLIAVLAAAPLAAQDSSHPDFSGTWVLDVSKVRTAGGPAGVGSMAPGGATIREPRKIKDVQPTYPSSARSQKISGSVYLEALIDLTGEIADLRIVRSVSAFDQAAMDAVSQWTYSPTLMNGKPVAVRMTVVVTFRIDGARVVEATPVPAPPAKAFGTGMGRGYLPTALEIAQDAKAITIARQTALGPERVIYGLDGKAAKNKLPNAGVAANNTYTYTSRWDANTLVTDITWKGPNGLRKLTETLARDVDTLVVTTTRHSSTSADTFSQTAVYTRQK